MLSNISRDIVDKEHPSFDENRKRVFCLGFLGGFNYSEKNPDANRETIDAVSRDSMNRSNPWYEEYEKETYLLGFNRGYSYVANDEARHYRQYMENPFSDQIGLGEATPDYDSADAAGLGVQFPILLKGTIIGWLPVDAIYDKDKPNHLISDDSHYLRMSSVGESAEIKKEYRGQGYGKAAYYELAVKAARMGMVLCSAPDSSRSENTNRLWKSLVSSGYARQNGDRYEFINSKIIVTNKAVGGIQTASKDMADIKDNKPYIITIGTDNRPGGVEGEFHLQFKPDILNVTFCEQEKWAKHFGGTMRVTDGQEWADFYHEADAVKFAEKVVEMNKERELQNSWKEGMKVNVPAASLTLDPSEVFTITAVRRTAAENMGNACLTVKNDKTGEEFKIMGTDVRGVVNPGEDKAVNPQIPTTKEELIALVGNDYKRETNFGALFVTETEDYGRKEPRKVSGISIKDNNIQFMGIHAPKSWEALTPDGQKKVCQWVHDNLELTRQLPDMFYQALDVLKDAETATGKQKEGYDMFQRLVNDLYLGESTYDPYYQFWAGKVSNDFRYFIQPTELEKSSHYKELADALAIMPRSDIEKFAKEVENHPQRKVMCMEIDNQNILREAKQAIRDRIVTPSARRFTSDQVEVLNRYHQVAAQDKPAGEVFKELLQEVSQEPDVARKPEKWVADTAKELDDLAEGITRGQDRGLHK